MTAAQSSDTELQEFEAMYQALVEEHFGTIVVPVADLIPFTEQLYHEAEQGDVPHRGKMHHIAPVAFDPTDEAAIRAATRPPARTSRWLALAALVGGPLLLGWLLLAVLFPSAPAPTQAAVPPTPPPAPSAVPAAGAGTTATPLPAPTTAPGFVTVAGQPLPDLRPTTLELGGRSFLVYVAPVKDGNWVVSHDPAVANWLPGATTNWAFALFLDGDTDPNAGGWLQRLQPGVLATLRVSSGSRPHQFRIGQRRDIARTQTEFLDPHQPGLTIAIKAQPGADTRILLQGTEEIGGSHPDPVLTTTKGR